MIATIPEMGHEENRCIDYVSVYKQTKKNLHSLQFDQWNNFGYRCIIDFLEGYELHTIQWLEFQTFLL